MTDDSQDLQLSGCCIIFGNCAWLGARPTAPKAQRQLSINEGWR